MAQRLLREVAKGSLSLEKRVSLSLQSFALQELQLGEIEVNQRNYKCSKEIAKTSFRASDSQVQILVRAYFLIFDKKIVYKITKPFGF